MSPSEKELYFKKLIDGALSVHEASPDCIRRLLADRLDIPNVTMELREILKDLHDPRDTSSRQHGAVDMTNDDIFIKTRAQLLDAKGEPITLDTDSDIGISWETRARARFYSFSLTVDGMKAFQGAESIKEKVSTVQLSYVVGLALPAVRQRPPGGTSYVSYIFNNNSAVEVLHPEITLSLLRNPTMLLRQVKAIQGFPPAIGYVKKSPGHLHHHIDSAGFYKDFLSYYERVFLDFFIPYIEMEFMAGDATDIGALTEQIMSKKQTYIDPETRAIIYLTVDEFYRSFISVLGLFSSEPRYRFDIAQVFWQGLNQDIRDKGRADKYSPPGMAFNENKQGSEERLRSVKEKALTFESEIKAIKSVVNRYTRNNTFAGRAAFAPIYQPSEIYEEPDFEDLTYPRLIWMTCKTCTQTTRYS